MDELWIVQRQRVDYDGYSTGEAHDKVGPFANRMDAYRWIDEVYPLIKATGQRRGIRSGTKIEAVDILSWVRSPEEAKKIAGR